jgi:hypothetical protein
VLAALVCVGESNAAPTAEPDPVRVMLVGDSSTQGSAGDWTWRYRLWRHLEETAPAEVDLVGPHDDLWDQNTRTYGHQTYVDPQFDRDHAARWGLSLAFPERPIELFVADYQVDVVVALLGIDDLIFLGHDPARVRGDVERFIADARSANPDVDVVLGELIQTWLPGATDLNALLHEVAVALDEAGSRVVVAETADGFRRRTHTYDRSHPGALGEVLIASSVADALAVTGIGLPARRPVAAVPRGPRIPVRLAGGVRHGKVRLSWSGSPGADSYRVLYRRPEVSPRWLVVGDTTKRRWVVKGLRGGERVQLAVLPRKGRELAEPDVLSNVVRVRKLGQNASRAGSA